MTSPTVERADRILVWLVLLTLIFGGLATVAVVFSADAVLAGLSRSAAEQSAPQDQAGHEGPMGHDAGAVGTTVPMPQDHAGMTMDEHTAMTPAPPTEAAPHGHSDMSMPEHTAPATTSTTP